MKYNGYIISDIHIGVNNIEKLYDEFTSIFINNIKQDKNHIDFIVICGDYFDHKLFLNQKESSYAYTMMNDIIDAVDSDTKIRLVYGTESHECNQYSIISKLSSIKNMDIKVVKYVEEEELLPNLNVLYLPEEHIYDKQEYYKDYFSNTKKYDYIFGHGIIREAMTVAATKAENNTQKRKKTPVFSTAELRSMCKGETYFGHYHVNTEMDGVYYVGSFSRWIFGEEERKGFYHVTYKSKDDKTEYKHEFIENTMCDVYKTISFGYQNKIYNDTPTLDGELDKIDKMIKQKLFDHVRFEFNIPEECENPEFLINYVNEKYKFNDKVKLEIVHGYIENKRQREKEEVKKENDKYSFIFDRNMKLEDKTSYFISIEYNRDISAEKISLYLYKPLNEILNDE